MQELRGPDHYLVLYYEHAQFIFLVGTFLVPLPLPRVYAVLCSVLEYVTLSSGSVTFLYVFVFLFILLLPSIASY